MIGRTIKIWTFKTFWFWAYCTTIKLKMSKQCPQNIEWINKQAGGLEGGKKYCIWWNLIQLHQYQYGGKIPTRQRTTYGWSKWWRKWSLHTEITTWNFYLSLLWKGLVLRKQHKQIMNCLKIGYTVNLSLKFCILLIRDICAKFISSKFFLQELMIKN